ncbi:MAG: nuclease-related domain-containing protein [Actinomycetota bacterium]|nr:nuclease-related domain-containing protein [Actinomycetota bacterium]
MATTPRHPYPQILGVPGLSLSGAQAWAASDEAREQGRKGEERTARVLGELLVPNGPTVLHSLRLPMSGIDADVDHVVVAGRNVWILDSKVWKPAVYWTIGGKTRRGLRRIPFADKHTSEMAVTAIGRLLETRGVSVVVHRPYLVVWPSNRSRSMRLGLYRPRGARVVHGEVLDTKLDRIAAGGPADQDVVRVLYPLLSTARLAAMRLPEDRLHDHDVGPQLASNGRSGGIVDEF